jgi:bilirubin oxidase
MDEADNEVLVNGTINGTLELPAQVVRMRLLNGSSHRFFDFGFADNRSFKQIASDAGLLNEPMSMTRLILGSGERAEILVDLSGLQGNTLKLRQYGTQLPQGYPGGTMMMGGMTGPKDNTDFDLLTIQIVAPTANAITTVPASMTTNIAWPQAGASTRSFGLSAQPMMSMTNFFINGLKFDMETVNFSTQVGKTEIWTITNQTMMAHPFHVHGMHFYVLAVNGATPPANLRGRKDVVVVPPMNGSVKIILKFEDFSDPHMPYMYHCHILSHEDTGMMGQFIVNSAASGTIENIAQEHLRISPTLLAPGLEKVEINADNGWEPVRIEVYDQDGRLLLTERNATRIAADRLASGMNSIHIFTARGTAVFKIVKTN